MQDNIIAYILFHPALPFKSFLGSHGNFGEFGSLYAIIKLSIYLSLYGFLCGKIFKYLDGAILEKKKEEMPTYLLLKYFYFMQFYYVLAVIFGVIVTVVFFLDYFT